MKIPSSVMRMKTIKPDMEQDKEKLKFLLDHWAEHNEEHKKGFVKWIRKAKENGLDDVAVELGKAVDTLNESTRHLQNALKSIENE